MIKNIKSALVGIFTALAFGVSAPALAALTVQADGTYNPNAPGTFGPRVEQTFTAAANGPVSFGWAINATYETNLFNAGYLVNGVETSLSTSWLEAVSLTTGLDAFNVSTGDSYGFFVYSVYFDTADGNGSGFLTITDLNAPASNIPEPGSLALLGLGLAGLAAMRRRKQM